MFIAVEFDRPEFVSFLLKGPIELNKFVGEGFLSGLYEKVTIIMAFKLENFNLILIFETFTENKGKNKLVKFIKEKYDYSDVQDIDRIINAITKFDNFNHVTPNEDNEVKCDGKNGANELFLFSILTGRFEIAKLFWKKGSVSY